MYNDKAFKKICENVKTFIKDEFQIEKNNNELFDKNLRCSLLYTFKGETDEFEYQVYLDLKGNQIIKEITYSDFIKHYEYERYDSWSDLAEVTKDLEFDNLYYTTENISDLEKVVEKIS